MKTINKIRVAAAVAACGLLAPMQSCDDGPLEEAGSAVDEAVEDTADAIEDAAD